MLDLLLVKRNAIDQPKIKRYSRRSNTSGWRGVYAATIATQLGTPLGVDDMGGPFCGSPPPSARVGFPHRERDNAISDLPEKRESFYFNSHISEVYYSPSHGDAV